jgi:hypothetical protein
VIKSRRMSLAGNVALWWRGEVLPGFWWENLRPLGSVRHRWEDNIKMDLQEVGSQGMDCDN